MRRLSPALLTMVMLGVVGLLVVLYVGKKLLARDSGPPPDPTVSVPMSLTDLEPGVRITEAHLANGPTLRSKLARDVVLTNRSLVGRVVKNKILATQPIKSSDLYAPGQNAPLALEPGMVAVMVQMSSPFNAKVGQYIDIHFTPDTDPEKDETGGRIMTLFKGVKILEMTASNANRGSANVTLELTREQATVILLAKDKGTLNFVYAPEGKGNGGIALSNDDRATLYEILGYTPKPDVPPTPPYVTEVFKGPTHGSRLFKDGRVYDPSSFNFNQSNGGGPQSQNRRYPQVPRGTINPNNGSGYGNETGGDGGSGPSAALPRGNAIQK